MGRMYLNRSIAAAVAEEMARDESVILLGEDILNSGGGLGIYLGVPQKFPDRCLDMPIAEAGFSYFGVGAAVAGMRPIVDMMFSDFASICADAVSNGSAKVAFMTQAQRRPRHLRQLRLRLPPFPMHGVLVPECAGPEDRGPLLPC